MPNLTPVTFDFDSHELVRLAAVLSACSGDLDLVTMHHNECDAVRMLYTGLAPEQRAVHQQLTDAGILNDLPKTMLRPVSFSDDDDERDLQVVKMVPVEESEDTW